MEESRNIEQMENDTRKIQQIKCFLEQEQREKEALMKKLHKIQAKLKNQTPTGEQAKEINFNP